MTDDQKRKDIEDLLDAIKREGTGDDPGTERRKRELEEERRRRREAEREAEEEKRRRQDAKKERRTPVEPNNGYAGNLSPIEGQVIEEGLWPVNDTGPHIQDNPPHHGPYARALTREEQFITTPPPAPKTPSPRTRSLWEKIKDAVDSTTDFIKDNYEGILGPTIFLVAVCGTVGGVYCGYDYYNNLKSSYTISETNTKQKLKAYSGWMDQDLYVSNEDGSNERKILETKHYTRTILDNWQEVFGKESDNLYFDVEDPKVSPDQKHVTFMGSVPPKAPNLYVIGIDGSDLRKVYEPGAMDGLVRGFSWEDKDTINVIVEDIAHSNRRTIKVNF
ncbi:MAG: hypothetical protein R6U32_01385 [Candidatus Woesearchaeota archaeon]